MSWTCSVPIVNARYAIREVSAEFVELGVMQESSQRWSRQHKASSSSKRFGLRDVSFTSEVKICIKRSQILTATTYRVVVSRT